jgi:ABC-2 type transport system ATP-binding protein
VTGVSGSIVLEKLGTLTAVRKSVVIKDEATRVFVRIHPKTNCVHGELAQQISDLAAREKWRVEELHTEEGRLDEVFRSITLPDTKSEEVK